MHILYLKFFILQTLKNEDKPIEKWSDYKAIYGLIITKYVDP